LKTAQILRIERMGARLWPTEKLSPSEIGRRLLLEYLLWSEDQHNMVERLGLVETSHKPRKKVDPGAEGRGAERPEPHRFPTSAS
jgi:hypothetical protein